MRCAQQIAQRRRHQGACIGSRNSSRSYSLFLLIKSKFLPVKAAFFQVEFHLLVKFSRCESHYQVDEDKIRRRNVCPQAAPRVMCSTLALPAGNFPTNGHFNWKIIYGGFSMCWIIRGLAGIRVLSWSSLMSLGWIGMNICIYIYILDNGFKTYYQSAISNFFGNLQPLMFFHFYFYQVYSLLVIQQVLTNGLFPARGTGPTGHRPARCGVVASAAASGWTQRGRVVLSREWGNDP